MKLLSDLILERLNQAFDVQDDDTLALKLGRDVGTLRVWRSRDMVPLLVLVEASKATGYSVEWLRCDPGAPQSASTKTPLDDHEQVLLSKREAKLVANYRASAEVGRRALDATGTALAQPKEVKATTGKRKSA